MCVVSMPLGSSPRPDAGDVKTKHRTRRFGDPFAPRGPRGGRPPGLGIRSTPKPRCPTRPGTSSYFTGAVNRIASRKSIADARLLPHPAHAALQVVEGPRERAIGEPVL